MAIKSIELVGFKRVGLANIQRIKIDFTERLQLILGSNGSGKSCTLREMTPLPAHPSNYTKNGSKTVVYELNGHTYVLRSTMAPSPRHSFRKNGAELNQGGTQSVQRELVLQEFGITVEIHNLLTGKERFTQMSPRRKRDWFTLLADVNYDYAIQVFNRIRTRAKQISGALDLAKKRLVVEAARVPSEAEQTKIRNEIDGLHHELEVLQSERAPIVLNAHTLQQTGQRLKDSLQQLETRTLRLRGALFGQVRHGSLEEIDNALQSLRDAGVAVKTLLQKAVTDHETLEKQIRVLRETGAAGIDELSRLVGVEQQRHASVLAERTLPPMEIDGATGLSAMASVRDVVTDVFQHLPGNEDRRFSQLRFKEESELRLTLVERKALREREYAEVSSRRKVMDAHRAMGSSCCPKCGHTWIAGYSDEQYQSLGNQLTGLEQQITILDDALKANRTELDAIEAYRVQYASYARTAKAWPVLQPFWDHLHETLYIVNAPRRALVLFEQLEHDLGKHVQATRHQAEISRLQTLIERARALDGESLGQVSERLQQSDDAIAKHTAELSRLASETTALQATRKNLVEYLDLGQKITETIDALETNTHEQIETLRLEAIHSTIRQVQIALAERTKALSEIGLQQRTISDLTGNIEQMQVEERIALQLAADLSPTDGLIAEGLLGSIRHTVGEMNTIIRKIWSYSLEVQACGIDTEDGAELDYRFPMLVDGEPVDDVGDGSTGQQEIINLAFRIVAMCRLKLQEPDLYLDEFGSGFDEAHRKSAAFAIQTLAEQQLFSRILMVSHNYEQHGHLSQCETTVLDATNITVPAVYNQHVSIDIN